MVAVADKNARAWASTKGHSIGCFDDETESDLSAVTPGIHVITEWVGRYFFSVCHMLYLLRD